LPQLARRVTGRSSNSMLRTKVWKFCICDSSKYPVLLAQGCLLELKFFITRQSLLSEGWKKVGNYLGYEIWAKNDNRLLFNKSKKQVYFTYKLGGGINEP